MSSRTSRFLSTVLRHKPEILGIKIDKQGWTDVETLLSKMTDFTMQDLEVIVETNNKQRFSFNEDKTKIRANQGHSIPVDLGLVAQVPPFYLFHGTAESTVPVIKESGIKKMNRNHVHLSTDEQTAIQVGNRKGNCEILVIRAKEMHNDDIKFYLSDNGVWLTDYVSPKYINFFNKLK